MNYQARLQKLHQIMENTNIDIVALIPSASLRYLTGGVHYVLERPIILLIPLGSKPVAIIPKLEIPLFERHHLQSQLYSYTDKEGYENAFKQALSSLNTKGKVIGVEGLHLRFFEGELLRKYAQDAIVKSIDAQLASLRLCKTPEEIQALRHAIEISEQSLSQTLNAVKIGMTEIEIADLLDQNMKQLGAEGRSFETIVHAGGNSALPHMGPLPYRVQVGDPLLLDFGAVYQGYCADITRTVFIGEPRQEFRDFYNVVKQANQAARDAVRPNVMAENIDIIARNILIEAGYEHLIRHRTGHGIGLGVHEEPYIVEGNTQKLAPGMVFTIEPGIYDMGVIGVRIEDNVLVTESGSETLTSFERDLTIIRG